MSFVSIIRERYLYIHQYIFSSENNTIATDNLYTTSQKLASEVIIYMNKLNVITNKIIIFV